MRKRPVEEIKSDIAKYEIYRDKAQSDGNMSYFSFLVGELEGFYDELEAAQNNDSYRD